jgi:hypothetical protein
LAGIDRLFGYLEHSLSGQSIVKGLIRRQNDFLSGRQGIGFSHWVYRDL